MFERAKEVGKTVGSFAALGPVVAAYSARYGIRQTKAVIAQAKALNRNEAGELDIKGFVVMIVSIMVGGILIGALMPAMSEGLNQMHLAGETGINTLIDTIPLLIVLAFVVGIIFWAISSFKK